MNLIDTVCVDLYLGISGVWSYLGLSWHHILQAFVTGAIIKSGYWLVHQVTPQKKKGNMATMSAIGSVIDESH